MAPTKQQEKKEEVVETPVVETTALAITGTTDVAGIDMDLEPAPDWAPDDRDGLESITKKDMLLPRLALAQPLSPQVTEGDPQFIEGLKPGDLFNSVTGKNYGRGVSVQIVRKDEERAMEFYDMKDGGGVADPDVPLNDPRCKWGADGSKPQATKFLDFLAIIQYYGKVTVIEIGKDKSGKALQKTVILPEDQNPGGRELIALSFKSSGIKVAKKLNGLIAFRAPKPMYAGRFLLTTAQEMVPKPHKVYLVSNDGWVDANEGAYGKKMHNAVKGFDVARNVDRSGYQAPVPEGTAVSSDIPF